MAVAKEQIRQIIAENNISSVADAYSFLKDSFKDILQELMEAALGYQKNQKGDLPSQTLFLRRLYDCRKIPVLFQRPDVGRFHKNPE